MQISIRAFTADDYFSLHALHRLVYPDEMATTEEQLRLQDQDRDPRCRFRRWVVEKDGKVVAVGEYDQDSVHYHPQVFVVDGMVHPAYQRLGIGQALSTQMIAALRPFSPLWIRKRMRADRAPGIRFLITRGFHEGRSLWESRLDLATVDLTHAMTDDHQVQAQGIEIGTLADLQNDPERNWKLFQLVDELSQDVPFPEPRVSLSYDDFVQYRLHTPRMVPEGYFIARHHDEYIGITELRATVNNAVLTTGLTAIKPSYRKRGIARTLKRRSIAYAKAHGYSAIHTTNDTRNRPILALNEEVGFVRQHLWLELEKGGME